jgi:cytochrome P450 / NADPH-cytochrome P450 reductase
MDQMIGDKREGRSESLSSSRDVLDLLLSSTDDQEIKDQSLTFIVAGHETTGNLITHEDVLNACQEDIDRILPNNIEPTHQYLMQLNICEAVIQEAPRLCPSAPFLVRECIREHTTIGKQNDHQLTIPTKANIVIDIYGLHRLPEFWPRSLE